MTQFQDFPEAASARLRVVELLGVGQPADSALPRTTDSSSHRLSHTECDSLARPLGRTRLYHHIPDLEGRNEIEQMRGCTRWC